MPNLSRYYLAEQVLLKLESGIADVINKVQIEDIIAAVGQKVNSILKLQQFTDVLQMGDTIPNNLMVATYPNIPITSIGTRCKATLPIQPVSLIRNMGVYMIDMYEDFRCPFIPIQLGLFAMLQGQLGISDLLGQVGFECVGNEIWLTKDLTINNVSEIYMRLLVFDINSYSDYDGLPIPQDMQWQIIDEVYKSFIPSEAQQAIQSQPIKTTLK